MLELIFVIILLFGFIGMAVIVFRKIPVLVELTPEKDEKPRMLNKIKAQIKNNGALKSFSGEILLQKMLSKIRILTLKTENKTADWLSKLRQKALEKKSKFSDDYWKKIKKVKK